MLSIVMNLFRWFIQLLPTRKKQIIFAFICTFLNNSLNKTTIISIIISLTCSQKSIPETAQQRKQRYKQTARRTVTVIGAIGCGKQWNVQMQVDF